MPYIRRSLLNLGIPSLAPWQVEGCAQRQQQGANTSFYITAHPQCLSPVPMSPSSSSPICPSFCTSVILSSSVVLRPSLWYLAKLCASVSSISRCTVASPYASGCPPTSPGTSIVNVSAVSNFVKGSNSATNASSVSPEASGMVSRYALAAVTTALILLGRFPLGPLYLTWGLVTVYCSTTTCPKIKGNRASCTVTLGLSSRWPAKWWNCLVFDISTLCSSRVPDATENPDELYLMFWLDWAVKVLRVMPAELRTKPRIGNDTTRVATHRPVMRDVTAANFATSGGDSCRQKEAT
mmetsp:Transcript_97160/g.163432  ORF Transcript_97160/g.163432 Transcript_97160/m.163432 type:complete len:295 (+) Transcript_97160:476-1360(+)